MPNWHHGLVIGKFLPPHRGHKFLIDTGRSQVDRLTIIICDKSEYGIPGELRLAWMRETHPDCEVILIHDDLPDDDSRLWAENTIRILGKRPDVVFTSEDYGFPYSQFLGSDHVLVDKERATVPISGTRVRNAPLNTLDFLEPCVRAYFVRRICILGAESTGTTTLTEALAYHYNTTWVPEYGREYWIAKMARKEEESWIDDEFVHIATEQSRREDITAREANRLLFCDTDAFATSVWYERYMNGRSERVEEVSQGRKYDLTILTGDEIPFVQDGFRDGESIRHWMHGRFIERLEEISRPFLLLRGLPAQRLRLAVGAVDAIINKNAQSL